MDMTVDTQTELIFWELIFAYGIEL